MNESKYQYEPNIPAEILPSIKANLERLQFLIPAWCNLVYVYYETSPNNKNLSEGAVTSSSCSYSYRTGCIYFHPSYFNDNEGERVNTCIHELMHLSVNILADYVGNEVDRLLPDADNPHRKSVMDGIEERVESVVCDLTHILQTRLGVGKTGEGI